jgi:hypothetical protein
MRSTNGPTDFLKEVLDSWYGCSGGDLRQPVWFCGFEWCPGDDFDYSESKISEELKDYKKFPKKSNLRYWTGAYANSARWIISVAEYIRKYRRNAKTEFTPQNKNFWHDEWGYENYPMFNLYPIPLRGHFNIPEEFASLTGFGGYAAYKDFCISARKNKISREIIANKPEYIIYRWKRDLDNFLTLFTPEGYETISDEDQIRVIENPEGNHRVRLLKLNKGRAVSNEYLIGIGREIAENLASPLTLE